MAVLAGAGIGLVSGFLIAYFGLAAFVVTLGMMAIGRSLAYILSGQTAISNIPRLVVEYRLHRYLRHSGERAVPVRCSMRSPGLI